MMESVMRKNMTAWAILMLIAAGLLLCQSGLAQELSIAPEKEELKRKAAELEKQGDHAGALKILESLTDQDYYVPPRDEICYLVPGHISGARQLAMMRCHRRLGNTGRAAEIAWFVVAKNWDAERQAVKVIAEETAVQGGVEPVRKRLKAQIKTSEYQPVAKEALAYLNILDAGKRHDYLAIHGVVVPWIKSAQWIHGHKWLQAQAICLVGEALLRSALKDLESGDHKRREVGAIVLSVAPADTLERADPELVRTLDQYKTAIRRTEDYREGNIAVYLLRAIATTRNSVYVEPLRALHRKDLPAHKFTKAPLAYTLGHLGDPSVIPQLQEGLEKGTYSHFVLPALQTLAGKPSASREEMLKWCRMKTTQLSTEGDEPRPAP
jgi:hypothetical protein